MNKKHYHLIGICGSSMRGVAQFLQSQGNLVTGSDINKCEIENYKDSSYSTKIKTLQGHSQENIDKDVDYVIRTSAVTDTSKGWVEIKKARELKISVLKRSEIIGKIINNTISIGITGMHGKTTTSSMLATILSQAKRCPGYFIGSEVRNLGGNSHLSKQININNIREKLKIPKRFIDDNKVSYFVVEACEYDRSFLDMKPFIGVITNIDKEHLDYYKGGLPEIKQAFKKFIKQLPSDGLLVVNKQDSNTMSLVKSAKCKVKYVSEKNIWPGLRLKLPGKFNLINATMAAQVAYQLGIEKKIINNALNNFIGAERRMQFLGKKDQVLVFDDYAHHPTEIKATLSALKEKYPDRKLFLVFQPHQQQRTKILYKDFIQALRLADEVVLTKVYLIEGREKETEENLSKNLVDDLVSNNVNAKYFDTYEDILKYINTELTNKDLLLTMGATNIYKVAKSFLV